MSRTKKGSKKVKKLYCYCCEDMRKGKRIKYLKSKVPKLEKSE